MGQIRIIGGTLRGRKVTVSEAEGLRPTSDRVRETLFNWLNQDLTGKNCLDLFAGSGILGVEALSRGARRVDFVEKHPKIAKQIQKNVIAFGLLQGKVHQQDAQEFLAGTQECYDIVFCDPPFFGGQIADWLMLIQPHLKKEAVVYLETEKDIILSEKWQTYRQLDTKQACCRLLYLE